MVGVRAIGFYRFVGWVVPIAGVFHPMGVAHRWCISPLRGLLAFSFDKFSIATTFMSWIMDQKL